MTDYGKPISDEGLDSIAKGEFPVEDQTLISDIARELLAYRRRRNRNHFMSDLKVIERAAYMIGNMAAGDGKYLIGRFEAADETSIDYLAGELLIETGYASRLSGHMAPGLRWTGMPYGTTPLDRRAASAGEDAEAFQSRVKLWMDACFGPEISADKVERNHRFLEEALELVQALGCSASEAHQLVDYVYGRPQGDINQEVGGVMVTLAALCLANGIDMHSGGETELARVWTKIEKIRAKQAGKPKHSPLPEAQPPAARAEVLEAAREIVRIYDECSGAEPSLSLFMRAVDVDLRHAVDAELEGRIAALKSQPAQPKQGEKP